MKTKRFVLNIVLLLLLVLSCSLKKSSTDIALSLEQNNTFNIFLDTDTDTDIDIDTEHELEEVTDEEGNNFVTDETSYANETSYEQKNDFDETSTTHSEANEETEESVTTEEETKIPSPQSTPIPENTESQTQKQELQPAEQTTEQSIEMPPSTEIDQTENQKQESPEISMAGTATEISNDSIIVYNFRELETALSKDNGYTNVYLGADITMDIGGIRINSKKKKVTISGINPTTGTGPYTIDEYNSLAQGYTINVDSSTGTKEVIMKDINIIGRNYYGTISVYDGISDVSITFENVNYNGPQISYNRGGKVRITGNTNIEIVGYNGLSDAQELAETKQLELGGNTVINHYSPFVSGVWLVGIGSYIKILSNSNVTWNETGSYTIFQDSTTPADFILEEGAHFTMNTINGLFYNTSLTYHQFGNVLIGKNASLKIFQQSQNATAIPVIKIQNSLQISNGASFILVAQSAPQLIYMTGSVDFSATFPNTFVLYNNKNKLLEWSNTSDHNVSIASSFLNYWNNPCEISALGGFYDYPLYRWRKKDGNDLYVDITATSTATKSVVSNYDENDYGIAPSAEILKLQSAKILTAGKMQLSLSVVTDVSTFISGETEPNANLMVTYTDTQNNSCIAYGQADFGGAFDIALESGKTPLLDSEVTVYSSSGYKNVIETTTVIKAADSQLMFIHIPKHMVFEETAIEANKIRIKRKDSDWHIVIGDTRSEGSSWSLYSRLKSPLSGTINDTVHSIEDAIIFVDEYGGEAILNGNAIKVAEGVKTTDTESFIGWQSDKGIMLDIDMLKPFSKIKYSARIEWLLIDAP